MSITTNPQSMHAMSLFDELAELFIKVKPFNHDPHQWIYSVDDTWLHPEDSDVEIALNGESKNSIRCHPVFSFSGKGNTYLPSDVPFTDPTSASGKSVNQADKTVADKLIQFVKEKADDGLLYGVCFCSFEYFWNHITEIDLPQNAVLFDIRHALGWDGSTIRRVDDTFDSGSLRDDWRKLIDAAAMFGSPDANEIMSRLGWYLHYAVKFNRIPGQSGSRCAVHSNHIQIVSSAVNPASGRSDALSDYSVVQQAIWKQLPADDRITPDLFAFSPMPKDDAMKTGLGVFHNSFKHAADWRFIRGWFLNDIRMAYDKTADQQISGHFANGDKANSAPWLWESWLPNEVKHVSDPLYKVSGDDWILLEDLLRMLGHSGVREFPQSWNGFRDKEVLLPCNPGFVFVYLLIEFIYNLGPGDGRQPPVVTYELIQQGALGNEEFVIRVTLQNKGAEELWKCYEDGRKSNGNDCGGASTALRALGGKTDRGTYKVPVGQQTSSTIVPNIVASHTPHTSCHLKIEHHPPGSITIMLNARNKTNAYP